ncbi:hypothetical protein K1719_021304 [Acacia pycnantha]|nr:hypothetical protein K1719_021304 [Acacia pycnantha]
MVGERKQESGFCCGIHSLTGATSQFLYTFALFPTRGRLYEYADNSVKATIESYKKACSDSSGAGSTSEANAQYYQHSARNN